jgi:C-terminal processing protease CtpA/Prc
MQAIGRATIVGERTPGNCLVAGVKQLANGATLVYPIMQSRTPDDRVLEGNGVIPDIQVELDRELLLQGIDSQLEEAIETIERQGTQ